MPRPTVAVLAYPGMSAFETGMVPGLCGLPPPELDVDWYRLMICAAGPVPMVGGAQLTTPYGLADLARARTVIVPGVPDVHAAPARELVAGLRRAHRKGARIVSICSGAFALAGAGLPDGRPATTHWRYAPLLRQRYPLVKVDADVLYVDDGDILTSAGSAAGLDLCVHLVRRDFGPTVANAVARRLVIPPHREGGQAQFIEAPVPADPDDDRIARSMAWAVAHLAEPVTVAKLARVAHMSTRSYLRHFARCSGTSPIRWLIAQRVQASLPLLEAGAAPGGEVAGPVRVGSPATFRYHLTPAMHTPPSAHPPGLPRPPSPPGGGSGPSLGGGEMVPP